MTTAAAKQPERNWLNATMITCSVILLLLVCCIAIAGGAYLFRDRIPAVGAIFASPTPTATKTQTPRPSPTRTPTPVPPSPTNFFDDFGSNVNNWPINPSSDEYGTISYSMTNGVYQWTVEALQSSGYWAFPDSPEVSNFTLEVDAQRISGPEDCSYGVVLRLMDGNNYYMFLLSDTQDYSFYAKQYSQWEEIIPWTFTESILPGRVNHITVVAEGPDFTFYINADLVGEASDERLARGHLGLVVELYNEGDSAIFQFDNFTFTGLR